MYNIMSFYLFRYKAISLKLGSEVNDGLKERFKCKFYILFVLLF